MTRLAFIAIAALSLSAHAGIPEATSTANSDPACVAIKPFYWELGDAVGAKASGSVGRVYRANSSMNIASASKWIYGAYATQLGISLGDNLPFLQMRSGYNSFGGCDQGQTVAECAVAKRNGVLTASTAGLFDYGGGHMQTHATQFAGLGPLTNAPLAQTINALLGTSLAYSQPQLAGGGVWTASGYAAFLRKLMTGGLELGKQLGDSPVCTDPKTCAEAISSPVPEAWHYSIGHWVEDDPVTGDGAFSSPGAFGFYPWISADRTAYGIVARRKNFGAWDSVLCGRAIRRAYLAP